MPQDAWYSGRHYFQPLTMAELLRGPEKVGPPAKGSQWTVVAARNEGVTPGFQILDASKKRYFIKFDPLTNPEMATAPDVLVAKIFYALGYNVPENHIISFRRADLVVGEDTQVTDEKGKKRRMTNQDLGEILMRVPQNEDGSYRAVASLFLPGKPLGPFRYHGTHSDDPNDIVPHEHRRDLRGLRVFCAWPGHDDSRAINTLDMLDNQTGTPFVKHYLIDFGSTPGSASTKPNSPRSGNVPQFSWNEAAKEFFSFGLYVPTWMGAKYPNLPSVGRFEYAAFDAENRVPEYYNPAFANMLPADAFWAARQVMAFTDEQIRALVGTGQYADPRAAAWVTECLIKRRDRVGKAFINKVLPLGFFEIRNGELGFVDVSARFGFGDNGPFAVRWAEFDNLTGRVRELAGISGRRIPATTTGYLQATITGNDQKRAVRVYVRSQTDGFTVVGIERD